MIERYFQLAAHGTSVRTEAIAGLTTFLMVALDARRVPGAIISAFLFDNTGTLVGVAHRAGLIGPDGKIPRLGRALVADSVATMGGALLGTSTVTSYIESAAGLKAGGRTGLVGVVVAALFLVSLFLSPLATTVPAYASAPALLFVACLMARGLAEVDWEDVTEYVPAVITAISMPLTFSIANVLAGRWRDVRPAVLLLAALFVVKFALL